MRRHTIQFELPGQEAGTLLRVDVAVIEAPRKWERFEPRTRCRSPGLPAGADVRIGPGRGQSGPRGHGTAGVRRTSGVPGLTTAEQACER